MAPAEPGQAPHQPPRSMAPPSRIRPSLLSKMNERRVLRIVQVHGPVSRADIARLSGITAPTASKAVASLLGAGLLEEVDSDGSRGRPAKRLRLAIEKVQLFGLVLDQPRCRLVCAGLDGKVREELTTEFDTPADYDTLIETIVTRIEERSTDEEVTTLGMGISMPGLIDIKSEQGVLSPNLPITDGRSPSRDLAARLGIECALFQESHALCLAQRHFGEAGDLDHFAVLDLSTGVGLGIWTPGGLLRGETGFAGEIGHIPVVPGGLECGCGRYGCLETISSGGASARLIGQRVGREVSVQEAADLLREDPGRFEEEIDQISEAISTGIAIVVNLFNPSTLFLNSRLLDSSDRLYEMSIEKAGVKSLAPPFSGVTFHKARGSKRDGAIAGIIQHLTDSLVPTV